MSISIYPRYVTIVYHFLITIVMMALMRFTVRRLYNEVYKHASEKTNALIYGAGDGGTMLLRTLSQDTASVYKVKAFTDDDPHRVGIQINTVKVFPPSVAMTEDFIKKNDIQVMILAIPSLDKERRKELIEKGLALDLSVKSIPAFNQWVDGGLKENQIQDIKIEDLLGRQPIILGKENVSREIKDKVVLVTGAAGSKTTHHARPSGIADVRLPVRDEQHGRFQGTERQDGFCHHQRERPVADARSV